MACLFVVEVGEEEQRRELEWEVAVEVFGKMLGSSDQWLLPIYTREGAIGFVLPNWKERPTRCMKPG